MSIIVSDDGGAKPKSSSLETFAACSGVCAQAHSHRFHRYQIGGAVVDSPAPIDRVEFLKEERRSTTSVETT